MSAYSSLADVGHRLLVEPRSFALQPDEKDLLAELKPQAFMFRARNFDFNSSYEVWLSKFSRLLEEIRACVGHSCLMLSIDHEGGRVVRPPKPITRFPYAAAWGEKVGEVARAMAGELASLGLNTSWAPVADVLTNPDSKAIGQRAFSGDPQEVGRKASIMAREMEAHGIAACAKHFPGYGPVTEDAHFDLPTAGISRAEWERVHRPPFVRLIEEGVRFVMTAHIMYPALDSRDQATLSRSILCELLRKELRFEGVVVADALGMGAIREEIEASGAVAKALLAELDLFCIAGDSVDLKTARQIATHMIEAVRSGSVPAKLMDRSRARLQAALQSLPQPAPKLLGPDVLARHAALARELDPREEWKHFQYIPKGFD